jgi:chemotaxis family two-component system sensor kinase Cph1
LIKNAIQFRGDSSPQIHISAEENNYEWIFSVKDNGIGIESEHKEDIFAVFQRFHSINGHDGTGMGLAICKKIVDCHSGRIWVESETGKGSIFYFAIPKLNNDKKLNME